MKKWSPSFCSFGAGGGVTRPGETTPSPLGFRRSRKSATRPEAGVPLTLV